MRNALACLFALITALGVAACGGSAPAEQFGKADAEQISRLVQDFVKAYNAKDVEKVGTFYAGDASLMPANRSTLNGVEAVKGFYNERFTVDGAIAWAPRQAGPIWRLREGRGDSVAVGQPWTWICG